MTGGRKDDQDKVRLELVPGELLFAVGTILTSGAKKYDARNWEQGIAYGRVFGALMRHAWSWWQGHAPTTKSFLFGELDIETGKSHLWHAACCLAFLITYEERRMTKWDDRPKAQASCGPAEHPASPQSKPTAIEDLAILQSGTKGNYTARIAGLQDSGE